MHLNSVTEVITAFSPMLIAVVSGLLAAWSKRQPKSNKIMSRLTAEVSALAALPDGSLAKARVGSQLDATALKYQEICAREDSFKRNPAGVVVGAVLWVGGVALATWAVSAGGLYQLWWIVALPAITMGVFGFFYELAGGKSQQPSSSPGASAS